MRGELGWLVGEVAHSMEIFKQSLEWLRRLDTLEVLRSEVEWRVKAQRVGGGGGCTIHLSCRWVVEEVIQFI